MTPETAAEMALSLPGAGDDRGDEQRDAVAGHEDVVGTQAQLAVVSHPGRRDHLVEVGADVRSTARLDDDQGRVCSVDSRPNLVTWDPDRPVPHWEHLRDRWVKANLARSRCSLLAFAAIALALLLLG